MLTRNSLYVILFALPVYQLMFYTVQLLTFKRSKPSLMFLGLLLLNMTLLLTINTGMHLGYLRLMSVAGIVFGFLLLTMMPTYYTYICFVTERKKTLLYHIGSSIIFRQRFSFLLAFFHRYFFLSKIYGMC